MYKSTSTHKSNNRPNPKQKSTRCVSYFVRWKLWDYFINNSYVKIYIKKLPTRQSTTGKRSLRYDYISLKNAQVLYRMFYFSFRVWTEHAFEDSVGYLTYVFHSPNRICWLVYYHLVLIYRDILPNCIHWMVLRCYARFDVDATTVSIFASMMMNDCNDLFHVDDGSNLRHLLVISLEKN